MINHQEKRRNVLKKCVRNLNFSHFIILLTELSDVIATNNIIKTRHYNS